MPRRQSAASSKSRTSKEKVFYFGAQYFRPPTPARKDWDRDFRNMKKCGMNIIRMWCLWSWHEPKEDQYDWDDIRGLLEMCRKHGFKAILLISLESTPPWLDKKHPEAVYIGHDGTRPHPDGFGNHPSGGFPGLNLSYPATKAAAEKFLRAIVSEFKDHPQVWGWEPHNEPIIEPARMKFDNEQVYSYNEPDIAHFRDWLKTKYKTLEKLNAAWDRKYGDWAEIEPCRRIPGGTCADFLDWALHNASYLIERVQWRCNVMRDQNPNIHLMIHTRAYTGSQGNPATWGMDDWRLAKPCDTWGGSSFYRRWPDAAYFLNNDVLYSCGKGKEYWLSEVQGGPPGGGLGRPGGTDAAAGEYTPEHMEMWTLMPVSQGVNGFMYWQWRMERKGPEWGYGVTNIDGSWSPRCERAKWLGGFLKKHTDFLLESQVMPYHVAVGYSLQTPILEFQNRYHPWGSGESLMGAYKCTLHLDLPTYCVRLDEEAVDDDYSQFKVISIPRMFWISPKSVQKLKAFVRAGGTVVADAGLAEYTSTGCWWSTRVPGEGLDELFGVHRTDVRAHPPTVGRTFNPADKLPHTILGRTFNTADYEETLKPTSAKIIGEWPDGRPAATINRYGKGQAIYIGSNAFLAYATNEDPALLDLYRRICADIPRPAWTDMIYSHVRVLSRGRQRMYFVFNYGNAPLTTRLTIPNHKGDLADLRHDTTVKTDQGPDGAVLPLRMAPFETRIFGAGF